MVRKEIIVLCVLAVLFMISIQEEFELVSTSFKFLRMHYESKVAHSGEGLQPEDLTENDIWTKEEPLEFDSNGQEETEEWKAHQIEKQNGASSEEGGTSDDDENEPDDTEAGQEENNNNKPKIISNGPPTVLPIVKSIEPSKNSNRTLANLWGKCTNETLAKKEKITYGIHIIMTFYKGTYRKDRFNEILMALRRNLQNPAVTAVHTLWEDRDPIDYFNNTALQRKLVRVEFGVQPTYKDLFDYANLRLGRGAVGVVLNSDIYFDQSLSCVVPVQPFRKAYNATKQHLVYALSRHPSYPCHGRSDYCDDYIGSHDAFVFALPLPYKFAGRLDFTQITLLQRTL